LRAEVSLIDEVDAPERESEVFVRSLLSQFEQYVQLGKKSRLKSCRRSTASMSRAAWSTPWPRTWR
jgi:hypothetical protein